MSWTDQEIEELYKDSVEEISFEYDHAYFEEMEAMLPKKKDKGYLWFFTALIFLGVTATGVYKTTLDGAMTNDLAKKQHLAQETNKSTNSTHLTVVTNDGSTTESSNQFSSESANGSGDYNQSSETNGLEVNSTHTAEDNATGQSQNYLTAGNSNRGNTSNQGAGVNNENPGRGTGYRNAGATSNSGVNGSETGVPTSGVMVTGGGTEKSPSDSETNALAKAQNPTIKSTAPKAPMNEKGEDSDHIDDLPLRALDNALAEELMLGSPMPKVVKMKPLAYLYLEANAGLSQSLVRPTNALSTSYGGGIGLHTQYGRWSLALGVNGIVANHSDITLNRKVKHYHFGSDIHNDVLDYRQVYLVEGNISLGYSINRHTITAGFRPSYVVGSKIYVTENSTDQWGEVTNRRRLIYGYAEGLYEFGLKPMVGYSYNLSSGWSVGMNIGMQMRPSFREEYINKVNTNLPIDGQVYFRKALRFKR